MVSAHHSVHRTSSGEQPHEVRPRTAAAPTSTPPFRRSAARRSTARSSSGSRRASVFVDAGAELQGPETATTVRSGENGSPVVVDGPYSEAKEAIGGFSVIDVENLDAALELARSWPSLGLPGIAVEVRPIVEHRMD